MIQNSEETHFPAIILLPMVTPLQPPLDSEYNQQLIEEDNNYIFKKMIQKREVQEEI